eukprot:TRINITY_DN4478_c0_g1_i1.p1 TRINITY_DN4478_c0_g1~~TRINITY_DN4478_c0_g1_i1.p1  ORF type:complete len:447 (+),score=129.03 TRINITY_DN4478_c0_g1_i1:59-1399(+)
MTVCSSIQNSAIQHRFEQSGGKQILTVDLPMLQSLQGVDLDVGSAEVRLLLPGCKEYMHIPLPSSVSAASEEPQAKFSKKRGQLTLSWPEVAHSCPAALEPEPQQTPDVAEQSATAAAAPPSEEEAAGEEILWKDVGDAEDGRSTTASLDSARDCLEEMEDELEHLLKQCCLEKLRGISRLQGASILLDDFTVEGVAWTQNQTLRYNVSVDFTWDVMDGIGGMMGVEGSGRITGLGDEDVGEPKVTIRSTRRRQVGVQAKAAEWMEQEGSRIIAAFLKSADIAQAVLSSLEDEEDRGPSKPAPPKKLQQERDVSSWANQWFAQRMGALVVKLFGGLAQTSFSAPTLSGTAVVSVERQPRFQLELRSSFAVTQQAAVNACAEGEVVVSTFSNATEIKGATLQFEAAPGKKASGQFLTALRKDGAASIRTMLGQFLEDFHRHAQSLPA